MAQKNYFPDVTVGVIYYGIGSTGLRLVATGDDAFSLLVGVSLPICKEKLDAGVRESQFKAARTAQQYDALWDGLEKVSDTEKAEWERKQPSYSSNLVSDTFS